MNSQQPLGASHEPPPRGGCNAGAYFARAGEPAAPSDLLAHDAVIYAQRGGAALNPSARGARRFSVTLKGRLREPLPRVCAPPCSRTPASR